MRNTSRPTVLLITLSCVSVATLSGAPIPIFGTGLDASGNFLAAGATDPHYTLTLNPLPGGASNTYVPVGANSSEAGTEGVSLNWPESGTGPWATDQFAQWIAPRVDVVSIPGVAMDTFYTYQTTFDLTNFIASTVQLSGNWTADNILSQVSLNGTSIYTSSGCGVPGNWSYQHLTPFNITSGFVPGMNTLTFNVTNSTCANTPPHSNPTGLLLEISGNGTPSGIPPVPEPGMTVPAALGLAFAACLYRRRRN